MITKTIIFLNLRFADFYSRDLFKIVKKDKQVRLVAVLDQHFKGRLPAHVAPWLDHVYLLPAQPKDGFLAEFDLDKLRAIVANELKNAKEVRMVCSDEFNLLNAGRLRREFGIKGHTDHELLIYRDKVKMKTLLAKEGIRVPRYKLYSDLDGFDNLAAHIGLPFVIKPVDSSGSHGVFIIHDRGEFEHFRRQARDFRSAFEVEEFISGALYHVDSFIKNGQVKFIYASEYTCPNHDYVQGKVLGSIPLESNHLLSVHLIKFAKKCLRALGNKDLINHMELFVTKNNEIIFLEVSARPPGGFIILTHKINYGINLMDEDFALQSGINLSLDKYQSDEHAFWALFPLRPGRVAQLNNPEVASRYKITWHTEIGRKIDERDCQSVIGRAAHAVFYNEDKEMLRRDFELIKQHQAVEVEPL